MSPRKRSELVAAVELSQRPMMEGAILTPNDDLAVLKVRAAMARRID
jgi:hypothetical protein